MGIHISIQIKFKIMTTKIVKCIEAEEEENLGEEQEDGEEEDEEDLVDPAVEIKEKCAEEHCLSYRNRLDECNERVTSKNHTTETCLEEILDFYDCVDHCAADKIFAQLK